MKIVPNTKIKVGFKFTSSSSRYVGIFIITEKFDWEGITKFKYENKEYLRDEWVDTDTNIQEALDSHLIKRV